VPLFDYPVGAWLRRSLPQTPFWLSMVLVGAFVFWRRPHDRPAQMLLLFGSATLPLTQAAQGPQLGDFVNGTGFWLYQLALIGSLYVFFTAWLCFALRFPQTHPLVERH